MLNKITLGIIGKNFGYRVIYKSFFKNKKYKINSLSFKSKKVRAKSDEILGLVKLAGLRALGNKTGFAIYRSRSFTKGFDTPPKITPLSNDK